MQSTLKLIQSGLIGHAPPWTRRIRFPHTIVARDALQSGSAYGHFAPKGVHGTRSAAVARE